MKQEIGYYKVKDKIFGNKFDAVMYAHQYKESVSWWFFDEQLNSVDWKKALPGLHSFDRATSK